MTYKIVDRALYAMLTIAAAVAIGAVRQVFHLPFMAFFVPFVLVAMWLSIQFAKPPIMRENYSGEPLDPTLRLLVNDDFDPDDESLDLGVDWWERFE